MKHKHFDIIVAWANGETLQLKQSGGKWIDIHSLATPAFSPEQEYRVKPKEPDYGIIANEVFIKNLPNVYESKYAWEAVAKAVIEAYEQAKKQ